MNEGVMAHSACQLQQGPIFAKNRTRVRFAPDFAVPEGCVMPTIAAKLERAIRYRLLATVVHWGATSADGHYVVRTHSE